MSADNLTVRFHCAYGRRWQRQRRTGQTRFSFQWRGVFAVSVPMEMTHG